MKYGDNSEQIEECSH